MARDERAARFCHPRELFRRSIGSGQAPDRTVSSSVASKTTAATPDRIALEVDLMEDYRAVIPPVTGEGPRPLWSVMIPTHDCAGYLRETLASVLRQDPGPEVMQIEVVDDHSTRDDPETVVRELGKGRV